MPEFVISGWSIVGLCLSFWAIGWSMGLLYSAPRTKKKDKN